MSDAFDSTLGWLAAGLAELLAHIRGTAATMPTKYQYPPTNTSLQNEGLALINLSEEMTAYFGGTLPSGGGGASVPTSVSVLPTLPSMTALNQTLQFTAVVKDQNNNILTPGVNAPALVWSSSNTTSATVDPVTGIATETGNGQTIITAMCGTRGGGTTLTTSGATTPVPTTVTISPASANLTASGATQQFTATVQDQNSNPLTPGVGGVPALVWSSLNTTVATINSSTGLATEVGNGSATIKCTCGSAGGTATLNCSGISSSIFPGMNMPAGMTVVFNTGKIPNGSLPASAQVNGGTFTWIANGITHKWTNFAPTTKDSTGFWSGNWVNPPNGATGLATIFDPTLQGGAEPLRLFTNGFVSSGASELFFGCMITLSSNWNFAGVGEVKIFNPITKASGNNHILTLTATGTSGVQNTGAAFPHIALQGTATGETVGYVPSGGVTNGIPTPQQPTFTSGPAPYVSASIANFYSTIGQPTCLEYYIKSESSTGAKDGELNVWVNGSLVYSTVGTSQPHFDVCTAGLGWKNFGETNDFGGGSPSQHPPATMYIVRDQYWVATR